MDDESDGTTEQLQQNKNETPELKTNGVASLELLNGTELISSDEESNESENRKANVKTGNDLDNGVAQKELEEIPVQDKNAGTGEATAQSIAEKTGVIDNSDKNVQESRNIPKSGEGDGLPDIDKDVDEADDKMVMLLEMEKGELVPPQLEGYDSRREMLMDSFPESQNLEQDQGAQDIKNEEADNSLLSNENINKEDTGATDGETDTSQIARELVQQALDRAVLTFNESSSAPSLNSTQEIDSISASPDPDKVRDVENKENQNVQLDAQDSVEEIETEVTFESVKHQKESDTPDVSQEIEYDHEQAYTGNQLSDVEDGDDGDSSENRKFAPNENSSEQMRQITLETALREINPDRENKDDLSDTECGSMGLVKLDPLPKYPDFPENYGNYKVCRNIEPGVKECIILETGECVRCKRSYSSKCKTGNCTGNGAIPTSKEMVPGVSNRENVDIQDDHDPSLDVSSSSSTDSGKRKLFRIVKSPKKDCGTAYMAVRSDDDNSFTERNTGLNSTCERDTRENFVSPANESDRQFTYLDNLRGSGQYDALNNQFRQGISPQSEENYQKPISYNQFASNKEESVTDDSRVLRNRLEPEQQEHIYLQRTEGSDGAPRPAPPSYSSLPLYSGASDKSFLSDPSAWVRYQRNLIARDFPAQISSDTYANLRQPPSGSESDRTTRQVRPDEQTLNSSNDQFELTESDKALLSEIYKKYGRSNDQVYDSFTSSVSGNYGRNQSASDVLSSSNSTGHIPSFNTLQEQQASWTQMFRSLEQEHQDELRHQYQRHQQAIFSLQQQVEREIHVQEHSFRKKLNAHKEMLAENVSPSRAPPSVDHQNNSYSDSFERVQETDGGETERGAHNSLYDRRSPHIFRRETSPPWREIYREIRKNIDDIDDSVSSVPVRRSLDQEFSSPDRSRTRQHEQGSSRSPREKKSGIKPELTPEGFPRAGVYSSPMPILRSKGIKSTSLISDLNRTPPSSDRNNSMMRVTSPSLSEQRHSSTLKHDLESRHRERLQQQEKMDTELIGNSTVSDDVYLSSSTRMNLREKHAKHLSDLREYYEKELTELRSAISTSENIMNQTPYKRVASENQNLHVENRLLKERVAELEEELDISKRNIRELEQKVHGLEVRASDYSDQLGESQSKVATFRNKMEEMQYQNREREQLLKELNAKVKYQAEALKSGKKIQDEQADIIIKDQSSIQKVLDRYNASEREQNILKEALNNTENKLYDARKEVVELNRTIAKLELENKRLGRENDNLAHKAHQSMNLSSIQGSFHEAFSSPEMPERSRSALSPEQKSLNGTEVAERLTHSSRNAQTSFARSEAAEGLSPSRHIRSSSPSMLNGSYEMPGEVSELCRTPTRNPVSDLTGNDLHDEGSLVASPLMKAEQDVYKLRNLMRSCVQGQTDLPELKLQKKFYGSEIMSQSRNSESFNSYGSPRLRREKSPSSSSPNSRNVKTNKSNISSTKIDRSYDSPTQSTPKRSQRTAARFNVEPGEFSSPTRFDVSSNSSKRSRSGSGSRLSSKRQPGDGQPEKDSRSSPKSRVSPSKSSKNKSTFTADSTESLPKTDRDVQVSVQETLNRVRSGVYVARPEWEDLNTSMAQPKKQNTESKSATANLIKSREDRIKTIEEMEHRYDDLQLEKRKLESALSKVSSHGKGRLQQEQLEDKLDKVEKELGSVRMSLKRWNILKTSS